MNSADRILISLQPPAGGWERLHARRDSASRWAPSWWSLASGGAVAAAVAWLAVATEQTPIRMPLAGARLIGVRSQGVDLQILQNGRSVAVPSSNTKVPIYFIGPRNSPSANPK
jgi:hypothetical protein